MGPASCCSCFSPALHHATPCCRAGRLRRRERQRSTAAHHRVRRPPCRPCTAAQPPSVRVTPCLAAPSVSSPPCPHQPLTAVVHLAHQPAVDHGVHHRQVQDRGRVGHLGASEARSRAHAALPPCGELWAQSHASVAVRGHSGDESGEEPFSDSSLLLHMRAQRLSGLRMVGCRGTHRILDRIALEGQGARAQHTRLRHEPSGDEDACALPPCPG